MRFGSTTELPTVVEYEGMRRTETTSPPHSSYPFSRLPDTKEGPACRTVDVASAARMWSSDSTWQVSSTRQSY
jgi:hypothetical protein